ncbi:zinc-dependent peptidase [Bordetella sp. LUAb4]|uniref:M90 family metallopeptidase n=1 Tax=Bordetella sp. LUAb4 TaxID=2843195 RepID=UPI001E334C93|nr:M90 family metallopeptidase [Bordetella sp. LUAb4]
MFRWLKGRGARDAQVDEVRARIPMELWEQVLDAFPFLYPLTQEEQAALLDRTAWVLASKTMNGAGGLALTDFMRLCIAAQAALPILNLEPALYEGWDEIIVYPGGFVIPRQREDADGVVHEYEEDAAGEAWDGGPVLISWEDARLAAGGYNVVIHEFAHKLDLLTGAADGVPNLAGRRDVDGRAWRGVLERSLDQFSAALEAVEAAIPPDVDPEGPDADQWYGQLPLDPYAATDEAEFFAVSSESFFADPGPLADAMPDWYALLRAYYRQDPLARLQRYEDQQSEDRQSP